MIPFSKEHYEFYKGMIRLRFFVEMGIIHGEEWECVFDAQYCEFFQEYLEG